MAIDPSIANALLQSQLAMHAVNNPAGVASLAASLGALPPPVQAAPIQVAGPAQPISPTPPTAQAAAPPPPPPPPAPGTSGVGVQASTAPMAAAPADPTAAAAAPAAAQTPADGGVTPADYTPPVAMGPVTPEDYTPEKTMAERMAQFSKVLGAIAPPSEPTPPPAVHSSLPPQGSYNPAIVADFLAALQGAQGGKGGVGGVASLGRLIGGGA